VYRAAIAWKGSISFQPKARDQNLGRSLAFPRFDNTLGVTMMDTSKKTFVLVHGAWHGGWCYRHTAAALRKMGHEVFTPTHTGVGERAHKADDENITLETHIRDVAGCIEAEEISDIILVGHSYGGMVITGLADRMADRIKALVYLDAFVPCDGESLMALLNKALEPPVAAQFIGSFRGAALEKNSGMTNPLRAEMLHVSPANREWVNRRCVPQALATFEMPVLLSGKIENVKRRVYILADGWDPSPFRYFAKKYAGAPGWDVIKLPSGHDVMVDLPNELAAALAKIA
jgi:pimeloyl-ACP methyl ester carboxylesterase